MREGEREESRGGDSREVRQGWGLLQAVSSRGNPCLGDAVPALGPRLRSGKQLAPLSFINIKVGLK